MFKFDDGCPLSIEPGNRHKILIPDKIINKILEDSVDRKIMFSVSDQLGNEVLSKPYEPPSEIH
ncbi:hypothetical protein [Candidatus Electrothrix sp.]|uniref:hypothetical protein n=1 Tax=Candidatus Electrothrix sp. TaxID=2170559 RepID=UPI004056B472